MRLRREPALRAARGGHGVQGEPVPAAPGALREKAGYGLTWWINNAGQWPDLPRDAFAAGGAGHQVMLVVPSLDLIAVRNGNNLDPKAPFWQPLERNVFGPLMEAAEA